MDAQTPTEAATTGLHSHTLSPLPRPVPVDYPAPEMFEEVSRLEREGLAQEYMEGLERLPAEVLASYSTRLETLANFARAHLPATPPSVDAPAGLVTTFNYDAGVNGLELPADVTHLKIWRIHQGTPRIVIQKEWDAINLMIYSCEFKNVRECPACSTSKMVSQPKESESEMLKRFMAELILSPYPIALNLMDLAYNQATGTASEVLAWVHQKMQEYRRCSVQDQERLAHLERENYELRQKAMESADLEEELEDREQMIDALQETIKTAVECLSGALADSDIETPAQTEAQIGAALKILTGPDAADSDAQFQARVEANAEYSRKQIAYINAGMRGPEADQEPGKEEDPGAWPHR